MKALHLLALVAVVACGSKHVNETINHPSATEYDRRAETQEREAALDQARFNPKARKTEAHCEARGFSCWATEVNPTQTYLDQAKAHRKNAARLRALSQTLRDVEATECAGLDEVDRDTSPFLNVRDIVNIEPYDVVVKNDVRRQGSVFTFRPAQGMTLEWFQKVIHCQVARNDALGHDLSASDCPLVPPNVTASVKQVPLGFAVEVSSGQKTTIAEIARRTKIIQDQRAALMTNP